MENGGSGGSDALTPETVLAAEGPPLEALGTRGGRGVGSCEKDMGLDGAGGAELAPNGDVRAQGRLELTLEELSGAAAHGAPRRGRGSKVGDVRASPPGRPAAAPPTLIPCFLRCVLATWPHLSMVEISLRP